MKRDFQVGEWTIQPQLNCVTRGTDVLHLEPKVMQVLVELSAQPGDVVNKEDLIRSVWPNTFVGDDVLIRCISELRRVFNDNPRSPRYIQTISKQGYRLIAPVIVPTNGSGTHSSAPPDGPVGEPSTPEAAIAAEAPTPVPALATPEPFPSSARSMPSPSVEPSGKKKIWIGIAIAALLLIVGSLAFRSWQSASPASNFRTVPFTSYPGSARQPAFSPDGNKIAFTWNGEDSGENWNIYVKLIGSETPLRLTSANAEDLSPAWSPDGNWIAFIRRSQHGNGIYMVPAIGGPERQLYELHNAIDPIEPAVSWSPDGKHLVFPDGKSESNPSSLVVLSVDTLQAKTLTHPKTLWDGDFYPLYSPDGKKIAFVRGADLGSRSLYVMDADGGEPKQLTPGGQQFHGLAWVNDGSAIVFSSDAGGVVSLWRVPAAGGTPQRLPVGSDKAYTPAISPKGNRLAYSQGSPTWSTMRVDLKSPRTPAVRLTSSKEQDFAPKFSHDGNYIVFQSWRSGSQEIWSSPATTTGMTKLTSFNGPLAGTPSWSPDDRQIAFDSRSDGPSHIFIMSANGGMPQRVTSGDFTDIRPDWSSDGKSLYFASNRNGSWQLWKVSLESGQTQQVTHRGGFVGKESSDGNWIYFTKYDKPGLWRMPASGGEEAKVLDGPPSAYWASFALSPTGIYFLKLDDTQTAIAYYDFAQQKTTQVCTLARRPARASSISVSPDDRWLLYTDSVSKDGDIVLVENFQ